MKNAYLSKVLGSSHDGYTMVDITKYNSWLYLYI